MSIAAQSLRCSFYPLLKNRESGLLKSHRYVEPLVIWAVLLPQAVTDDDTIPPWKVVASDRLTSSS
jgi:hypothetical protein